MQCHRFVPRVLRLFPSDSIHVTTNINWKLMNTIHQYHLTTPRFTYLTPTPYTQTYANVHTIPTNLSLTCWKCEAEVKVGENVFPAICSQCGRIQKYKENEIPDYFRLLGQSKPDYSVDLVALSSKMKKLQKQLHPDLFSNRDPEEQELSQQLSSLVNQAIVTLQNPIERGLYLLRLRGVFIDFEKQQILDPEFLTKVLELNEELESISDANSWENFRRRNNRDLESWEKKLEKAFQTGDLQGAQIILGRMKYYENLQKKLKEVQSKFNIVD